MPRVSSTFTRRTFLSEAAAASLLALMPCQLIAEQRGTQSSEPDDPQFGVIPQDTLLKFNSDGTRRPFAGNTVICHLPQESHLRDSVASLTDALRFSSFAAKLAILPSNSHHVTVLGGPNDLDRAKYGWPADVAIDATIEECNRIVGHRFAKLKMNEQMPIRFCLDKQKTLAPQRSSGLQLVPADVRESFKLRRLRDRIADDVFRYRTKDHDTFGFHISLAYQMKGFTSTERKEYDSIMEQSVPAVYAAAPVIELGVPEFCTFEDMYRFEIRTLLHT